MNWGGKAFQWVWCTGILDMAILISIHIHWELPLLWGQTEKHRDILSQQNKQTNIDKEYLCYKKLVKPLFKVCVGGWGAHDSLNSSCVNISQCSVFSERMLAYARLFFVFKEEDTKHIYYHGIYGIKTDKNTSIRGCLRVPKTSSRADGGCERHQLCWTPHVLSCPWVVITAQPKADGWRASWSLENAATCEVECEALCTTCLCNPVYAGVSLPGRLTTATKTR